MTRSRRTALLPLLLLLPLGLAACGEDGTGPTDDVGAESTVEAGEGGDAGSDSEDGEDSAGGEEVGTDLVAFELPEGWTVLDTETMSERAGSDANPLLEEMAGRAGLSTEQFAAQVSAVELYAAAPGGAVDGFLTNVNVIEQPLPPGGLPEAEGLRPELMVFADEVGDITELDTPGGLEGLRAVYRLESEAVTVNGEQIYAEVGDELVIISISASDPADAAEVADLLEATLVEAG